MHVQHYRISASDNVSISALSLLSISTLYYIETSLFVFIVSGIRVLHLHSFCRLLHNAARYKSNILDLHHSPLLERCRAGGILFKGCPYMRACMIINFSRCLRNRSWEFH